jgi:hypothetical protein
MEAEGVVGGAGTRRVTEVPAGRRGRQCLDCGAHRPLFRVRGGAVKSDREHTLCFRCRRSLRDQVRARMVRQASVQAFWEWEAA